MLVRSRWVAALCAATTLGVASAAQAQQEARFTGFTNGCFGVGCMPTIENVARMVSTNGGALTFYNSQFDATTQNLFLALGGDPRTGFNFNNLGAFNLNVGAAGANGTSFVGQQFNLAITFTRPSPIQGGQTTMFTALLSGALSSTGNGGVRVDFGDNEFRQFEVGPVTAPIGLFEIRLNDVSVNPNATPASVTADINATAGLGGAESVVPEPATVALLGTGMLGLLGASAAKRRRA